jgi:hypothetical protein
MTGPVEKDQSEMRESTHSPEFLQLAAEETGLFQ